MEAAAALAAHAGALNELLREREQLLLDRQRLALQAEDLRREVAQLRGAAAWAAARPADGRDRNRRRAPGTGS